MFDLHPVVDAVVVCVGVKRKRPFVVFIRIDQAVFVGIVGGVSDVGIRSVVHFPLVGQTVGIRVPRKRIRAVGIQFIAVRQPVVVGVRIAYVRTVLVFLKVGQVVAVGVQCSVGVVVGIEPQIDFTIIRYPVAVRIGLIRIGVVNIDFIIVGQTIAVRIRIRRARAMNRLLVVGKTIVVAVLRSVIDGFNLVRPKRHRIHTDLVKNASDIPVIRKHSVSNDEACFGIVFETRTVLRGADQIVVSIQRQIGAVKRGHNVVPATGDHKPVGRLDQRSVGDR